MVFSGFEERFFAIGDAPGCRDALLILTRSSAFLNALGPCAHGGTTRLIRPTGSKRLQFGAGRVAGINTVRLAPPVMPIGINCQNCNSTVTTFGDGKVVNQHDSGYIARFIPTEEGKYIVTERSPSGTLSATLPDGTRMVETVSGKTYSFEPDGSHEIMRPNGLRLHVAANGTQTYTHPNGTQTRFDTSGKTRNFK